MIFNFFTLDSMRKAYIEPQFLETVIERYSTTVNRFDRLNNTL